MIAIWNQKEVYFGYSLKKFSEVREILSVNKIIYKYRIVSHNNASMFGSRRARTGTFGENTEYENIYYIYVHKRDYENACSILQSNY